MSNTINTATTTAATTQSTNGTQKYIYLVLRTTGTGEFDGILTDFNICGVFSDHHKANAYIEQVYAEISQEYTNCYLNRNGVFLNCGYSHTRYEIVEKEIDKEINKEINKEIDSTKTRSPFVTTSQAREFYRDLCGTVYGDANKNSNGIMSVEKIAELMHISVGTANDFCNAMLRYGITEKSCGMIVV